MKRIQIARVLKGLVLAVALLGVFVHPAYADLEGSVTSFAGQYQNYINADCHYPAYFCGVATHDGQ